MYTYTYTYTYTTHAYTSLKFSFWLQAAAVLFAGEQKNYIRRIQKEINNNKKNVKNIYTEIEREVF